MHIIIEARIEFVKEPRAGVSSKTVGITKNIVVQRNKTFLAPIPMSVLIVRIWSPLDPEQHLISSVAIPGRNTFD